MYKYAVYMYIEKRGLRRVDLCVNVVCVCVCVSCSVTHCVDFLGFTKSKKEIVCTSHDDYVLGACCFGAVIVPAMRLEGARRKPLLCI